MKVKELLEEINNQIKEYGADFLDWEVYTEQLTEFQKKRERKTKGIAVKDGEGWEYFRCWGFWTKMPTEKIFTVNVNY